MLACIKREIHGVRDVYFKRTRAALELSVSMEPAIESSVLCIPSLFKLLEHVDSTLFFDRPLPSLKVLGESCSAPRKAGRFNAV